MEGVWSPRFYTWRPCALWELETVSLNIIQRTGRVFLVSFLFLLLIVKKNPSGINCFYQLASFVGRGAKDKVPSQTHCPVPSITCSVLTPPAQSAERKQLKLNLLILPPCAINHARRLPARLFVFPDERAAAAQRKYCFEQ